MSTLTSKGQVTIPMTIRKRLSLEAGDELRWTMRADGVVEIRREDATPLSALAGMLRRPKQRVMSVSEMDAAIERTVASRNRPTGKRARRR